MLCGGLTRMAEQAIARHDADLERDILAYESHLDQAVNWYSFIRYQFNVVQQETQIDQHLWEKLLRACTKLMQACLLYRHNSLVYEIHEQTLPMLN